VLIFHLYHVVKAYVSSKSSSSSGIELGSNNTFEN